MLRESKELKVKVKIWIEDENGKMVFGTGRMRILEAVHQNGSILAAAKELGMSYRAVWGKIKASEERLGQPLVRKHMGGPTAAARNSLPLAKPYWQTSGNCWK